ncbi:MAG: hypothetical protein IJU81_02875 [Bacteroidales bacterium]|nr:hypothetical protein [Bacteroidales bacterium]
MKHVFVVNPGAGSADATRRVEAMIAGLASPIDYQLYRTQRSEDATLFVGDWLAGNPGPVRFYACGGDGTINEVASAIASATLAGQQQQQAVELACLPTGSGNDYIKTFGSRDDFLDLQRLVDGTTRRVDIMQVDVNAFSREQAATEGVAKPSATRYCINICNFGFDAEVCRVMNAVRRFPLIGGKNAYTTGIVKSIFTSLRSRCSITVDGNLFHDGAMLLCTLANGRYVGGKYQCAPMSVCDDGLLELNLFRPISLLRFASLLSDYESGAYCSRGDIADIWRHCRGTVVEVSADKPFYICLDGEMLLGNHYRITNHRQALAMVLPQGL